MLDLIDILLSRHYKRKEQKDREAGKKVGITYRLYKLIYIILFTVIIFTAILLYQNYVK